MQSSLGQECDTNSKGSEATRSFHERILPVRTPLQIRGRVPTFPHLRSQAYACGTGSMLESSPHSHNPEVKHCQEYSGSPFSASPERLCRRETGSRPPLSASPERLFRGAERLLLTSARGTKRVRGTKLSTTWESSIKMNLGFAGPSCPFLILIADHTLCIYAYKNKYFAGPGPWLDPGRAPAWAHVIWFCIHILYIYIIYIYIYVYTGYDRR